MSPAEFWRLTNGKASSMNGSAKLSVEPIFPPQSFTLPYGRADRGRYLTNVLIRNLPSPSTGEGRGGVILPCLSPHPHLPPPGGKAIKGLIPLSAMHGEETQLLAGADEIALMG
jgi:hypothetical protein